MELAQPVNQFNSADGAAFILSSVTCPFLTSNHALPALPTLAGSLGCNEYCYLAGQDLSSDRAVYKGLHVLPRLFFLHRRGCIEGDFHHRESFGFVVRRVSNQRPGLQVVKRSR